MLDAIYVLHAMDEKMFNDYLIGKWKFILYVIHDFFNIYMLYM